MEVADARRRGGCDGNIQHPPNATATGNLEGGRSPSLRQSQSSLSDIRLEDNCPVDKKPQARRRRRTAMIIDDMYNNRLLLLSWLLVELGAPTQQPTINGSLVGGWSVACKKSSRRQTGEGQCQRGGQARRRRMTTTTRKRIVRLPLLLPLPPLLLLPRRHRRPSRQLRRYCL